MDAQAEKKSHILWVMFMSGIVVIWWVSIWNLADDLFGMFTKNRAWARRLLYVTAIVTIAFLFSTNPGLLASFTHST